MNNHPFSAMIPAAYAECCYLSNQPEKAAFQLQKANQAFLTLLALQSEKGNEAINQSKKEELNFLKNQILEKSAVLQPLGLSILELPFQGQQFHLYVVLLKKEFSNNIHQRIALAVVNNKDFINFFQKKSGEDEEAWQDRQLENSLFTSDHAFRMRDTAKKFGEYAKFSPEEINEWMILAAMHDIGKIYISPDLLNYTGIFNNQEREEMQNHTLYGYLLLHNNESMSNIAPLVLTHHERWDGSGYPIGLKGKEIPLASRVIALLDSYDAMVNDRPYRKALSQAVAIEEIEKYLGSQFDPILGRTFIEFLKK